MASTYKCMVWRKKTFTPRPCAARKIIFQKENLNIIISSNVNSLFYSVYPVFLFFSFLFSVSLFPIANLFAVRYLWDICNADKCWVVTHRAVDLFTCLVYVRTYCVPVKTLNQNERTRFFSTYVCLLIAANLNKGRMQRPYHPWFILPYSYLIHLLGGLACFLFHEYIFYAK